MRPLRYGVGEKVYNKAESGEDAGLLCHPLNARKRHIDTWIQEAL